MAKSDAKPKIFNRLYSDTTTTISFPVLQALDELTTSVWKNPASTQATPRNIENLYKVRADNAEHIINYPSPFSVVIRVCRHFAIHRHFTIQVNAHLPWIERKGVWQKIALHWQKIYLLINFCNPTMKQLWEAISYFYYKVCLNM